MRVFYNNEEITKQVQRLDGSFFEFSYLTGEYFYIASDFPFNHLFIKLGADKNAVASTMNFEYYGTSWSPVVDISDETNAFFQDGNVEFTPNKNASWARVSDSSTIGISATVYDKYWARVSFSDALTSNLELSFIGNKFCDDTDLFSEYPVFDDANFLTAFKAGKTSWEEQSIKASEIIIQDLQKKNVIIAPEQILDRKKFIGACTCKTAEIIFTAFGNDYLEQRKAAKEEYSKRLDLSQYNTDKNNDAILSPDEYKTRQNWLSR